MDSDTVFAEDQLLPQEHPYLHVTVLGRAMLVLERSREQRGFAGNVLDFFYALECTEDTWTRWIELLGRQYISDWYYNQARQASMRMQMLLYRLHVRQHHVFIDLH